MTWDKLSKRLWSCKLEQTSIDVIGVKFQSGFVGWDQEKFRARKDKLDDVVERDVARVQKIVDAGRKKAVELQQKATREDREERARYWLGKAREAAEGARRELEEVRARAEEAKSVLVLERGEFVRVWEEGEG